MLKLYAIKYLHVRVLDSTIIQYLSSVYLFVLVLIIIFSDQLVLINYYFPVVKIYKQGKCQICMNYDLGFRNLNSHFDFCPKFKSTIRSKEISYSMCSVIRQPFPVCTVIFLQ